MANIDLLVIESEKKKRRPSQGMDPSFGTISVGGASPIAISKDGNGNFDFAALKLSNVATPTLASDAATKGYVDVVTDFTKPFINVEGSAITAGQVVYESATGDVRLAKADQTLNYGTTVGIVADASIANAASGRIYVRPGATIGGFAGLIVNQALYVSRVAAGSLTQSLAGFLPGEHVVSVGTALDSSTIILNPEYIVEY